MHTLKYQKAASQRAAFTVVENGSDIVIRCNNAVWFRHFNNDKPTITAGYLSLFYKTLCNLWITDYNNSVSIKNIVYKWYVNTIKLLRKSNNKHIRAQAKNVQIEEPENLIISLRPFQDCVNIQTTSMLPLMNIIGIDTLPKLLNLEETEQNITETNTVNNLISYNGYGHNAVIIINNLYERQIFDRPCWGALFNHKTIRVKEAKIFISFRRLSRDTNPDKMNEYLIDLLKEDCIISKLFKKVENYLPVQVLELNLNEYSPTFIKIWLMSLRNRLDGYSKEYDKLIEKGYNKNEALLLCGYITHHGTLNQQRDVVPFYPSSITMKLIKELANNPKRFIRAAKLANSCQEILNNLSGNKSLAALTLEKI